MSAYHGLLPALYVQSFDPPKKMSSSGGGGGDGGGPDAMPGGDGDGDGGGADEGTGENDNDSDCDVPEPIADAFPLERQKTYRANAVLFLIRRPLARLWSLLEVLEVQQAGQRRYLEVAGAKWDSKEHGCRMAGNPERYRVELVRSGYFVLDFLRQYAQIATSQTAWEHMPSGYKQHALAVTTFRSIAAASAS